MLINCCEFASNFLNYHMQELKDIATTESIKGKHFFLETDMKGPSLKLDNTGKAILTVSSFLPFLSFADKSLFMTCTLIRMQCFID